MFLKSDTPIVEPSEDLFGYSNLALYIATSIRKAIQPKGLVLSVNAPWGYGKSSLLNFFK